MPEPLQTWLRREKARFSNVSDKEMDELYFHRDPRRPVIHDPSLLLSPADGVVLYSGVYGPNDPIEVKGATVTLAELMEGHWVPTVPSLVIGIFMTFYHVHVNRVPAKGLLFYRELSAIKTQNMPMIFAEDDLMKDAFGNALDQTAYQRFNARTINRLSMTSRDRDIFVLQIADSEVNVITPFTARQGWLYMQGERFSMIRYGSQVNLIVPGFSVDELGAIPLVQAKMCVEGTEPIVRLL